MSEGRRASIPEIRTERLRLRGFADEDREPFADMNAHPEVMELFQARLTRAESDALVDRILERWVGDGHGLWAVERLEDGRFLGFTGIARLAWLATPEIGWRFARDAWGHGYATEAARAALAWAFGTLGLAEVVSVTALRNERSMRVMERIGMTRRAADDFLHPALPEDSPLRPHVMYRIRHQEWERLARR